MSNSRASGSGFTLIEVIMTAGIVLMFLSAAIFYFVNARSSDAATEKESEYYRLYSTLEMKLKKDLRSCQSISAGAPGEYKMVVVSGSGGDGVPSVREVIYRSGASGAVVERIVEGKVEKFDFTQYTGKDKFVFKIDY